MRRVIIDGHNLLLGTPRYAPVVERDMDAARERLLADLGARAADGAEVTVVFDGGGNPSSDGEPCRVGGITVIFSPTGTEADSVIEQLASAAREAGEQVEVITSDGATRWTAMGGSVTVKRVSAFARELEDDETSWRQGSSASHGRATVADSIPRDVRAVLDRLAGRRGPEGP